MGKLIDYRNAAREFSGRGATMAAISGADATKLQAEYIALEAGGVFERAVPAGCDQHLFVLSGSGSIAEPGQLAHALKFGSFVLVEEAHRFVLQADVPCEVLSVLTPPPTVSGMKTRSAVRATTSTIVSRPSLDAVMSRNVSSSAPSAS